MPAVDAAPVVHGRWIETQIPANTTGHGGVGQDKKESGLGADAAWYVVGQEHPEQTVDWLARQFPKMIKAFQTVGAL